jgi:hypothetical protein
MCNRCGKHERFIAECPEAMEVKPEHKHHPRPDHKHCSRDDHKGKNKSKGRPWKSAPIVTNEPERTNCFVYLDDLTVLKEEYASKAEELDVLKVELDEMKYRPSLLGACTSCPVLHEKLDVSLVYARSLEAQLKALVPASCSTCEINVVTNMELAHYVDRLQDENDALRKMMGWLFGHEPQPRMMIETYKRYDGEALGANKVGEESGENEGKIGNIPEPPKTHHKNAYTPKRNRVRD